MSIEIRFHPGRRVNVDFNERDLSRVWIFFSKSHTFEMHILTDVSVEFRHRLGETRAETSRKTNHYVDSDDARHDTVFFPSSLPSRGQCVFSVNIVYIWNRVDTLEFFQDSDPRHLDRWSIKTKRIPVNMRSHCKSVLIVLRLHINFIICLNIF